jgi:dynein heavy chain, axonemal
VEPEEEEEQDGVKKKSRLTTRHLNRFYTFALVWGMGGLLDTADRVLFDAFLREKLALDLPKGMVFDYVVSPSGIIKLCLNI